MVYLDFNMCFSFTETLCLDVRQEQCFTRYKHGQCTNPLDGLYNKNLCCCSPVGKAWGGDRCEPCPRPGTATFAELCPKGSGFLDRKDINECTEFPGMCANGRCKNNIGSYNCKCNKGYALDEFKIKCIGEEINILKLKLMIYVLFYQVFMETFLQISMSVK